MRNATAKSRTLLSPAMTAAASACLILVAGGCGAGPGAILESRPDSPRWPQPPDMARIEYVGEIKTDQDLKPSRSMFEKIGAGLFGEEPPISMVAPVAVCTDGAARLFVADTGSRTLHVFDLQARTYAAWTPPDGFSMPVAVAFDAAGGRVLVSDSVEECIFAFSATGTFLGTVGGGGIRRPCGIAVANDGRLLVVDVAAHEIVVLSPRGEEISRIGGRGAELGKFNYPTNIAIDSTGLIFVTDTLNFRVQVFSPDLLPLHQIGSQGDLPGYFLQPKGIAIDSEDHVYVVDSNFEAVQIFTTDGDLLMSMGREGTKPGEFWLPSGITIDPKGRLFVADSYNQRVQVFQYLQARTEP